MAPSSAAEGEMGSNAKRGGEGVRYRKGGGPKSFLNEFEGMARFVD